MRGLVHLAALGAGAWLAGCVFPPVELEGRACGADSDCIDGYACSTERVCVLVPDSGRPDADRPDAPPPDVGRDAAGDAVLFDAPEPGDASGADDASTSDAPAPDTSVAPDATELDAGEDAAIASDAP